jgi:predicted phosphodiesterase
MQIGIVADIHEAIEPLRHALAEFRSRGVEVVINLGDACDTFTPVGRSPGVVALLRGAGAVDADPMLIVSPRGRNRIAEVASRTLPKY